MITTARGRQQAKGERDVATKRGARINALEREIDQLKESRDHYDQEACDYHEAWEHARFMAAGWKRLARKRVDYEYYYLHLAETILGRIRDLSDKADDLQLRELLQHTGQELYRESQRRIAAERQLRLKQETIDRLRLKLGRSV